MAGLSVAKWPPPRSQLIFPSTGKPSIFVMAEVSIAKWPPPTFSNLQTANHFVMAGLSVAKWPPPRSQLIFRPWTPFWLILDATWTKIGWKIHLILKRARKHADTVKPIPKCLMICLLNFNLTLIDFLVACPASPGPGRVRGGTGGSGAGPGLRECDLGPGFIWIWARQKIGESPVPVTPPRVNGRS